MKTACPHCGGPIEVRADISVKALRPQDNGGEKLDPAALAERRVQAYVEREGCISERLLYRRLHMSFSECAKIVDNLRAEGVFTISGGQPRMVHLVGACSCDV